MNRRTVVQLCLYAVSPSAVTTITRRARLKLDRLRRPGEAQLELALVAREEAFEKADGLGGLQSVQCLHVLILGEALAPVWAFEVAAAVGRRGVERARADAQLARGDEGVVVFEFEERVIVTRAEFFEAGDAVAEEVVLESEVRVVADDEADGRRNLLVDLGDRKSTRLNSSHG